MFKTHSRQDRCLRNFTDWPWKKSYFPAFSSNKVCIGMKAGQNAIYDCCGNSVAIMKDQVEHQNKIGVATAMKGEDVDEAVKSGSCEIAY